MKPESFEDMTEQICKDKVDNSKLIAQLTAPVPKADYDVGLFFDELKTLINKYSKENVSNTPDFILANFLNSVLIEFDSAIILRDKYYKTTKEYHDLSKNDKGK